MTETPDQRGDRLLHLGLDVATRIRDEDPTDVRRALEPLDLEELRDLAMMMAVLIPVQVPLRALTAWWDHPPKTLQPCGTRAAAQRHRDRKEPLDPLCAFAEKEWDRARKRVARREAGVGKDQQGAAV